MVDYFALIAPTIESLAKSTVEERRQVYDRLIKMLEAQLRSADPPRSEIDILRERIDLEAAIRRVERRIQAGQIAVGSPLNPDALKPVEEQMGLQPPPIAPKPVVPEPEPAPSLSVEIDVEVIAAAPDGEELSNQLSPIAAEVTPVDVPDALPIADEPKSAPPVKIEPKVIEPLQAFKFPEQKPEAVATPRPTDWASLVPQPRPVDRPSGFSPRSTPRLNPEAQSVPQPPATGPEAADYDLARRPLGQNTDAPPGPPRRPAGPMPPFASPLQSQPPRAPQSSRDPDPSRPIYGQRGGDQRQSASRLDELSAAFRSMPGAPGPARPQSSRQFPSPDDATPLDPAVVEAGQSLSQPMQSRRVREPIDQAAAYNDPSEFLRSQAKPGRSAKRRETVMESPSSDAARPTVSIGDRSRVSIFPTRGSGGWKRMAIIATCVVAILGGIAMTAYLLRDDPAEFKNATGKYAATEKPAADEKISDRLAAQPNAQNSNSAKSNTSQPSTPQQSGNVSQANPSSPTPDANGVLTQKAMLMMEPTDQSTTIPPINGRVTWKLETLKSAVVNASEIGSRATVDLPEVGLSAAFVFRRNRDPQSANSHMIEVTFSLSDTNTTGKVRDIRVPELRSDEISRGTPLSGIPVPVTENVFLIGLNALPAEMQKNLDLLRSQNWFAMPIRFANGKRGFLMFEKGKTGERVMEDAMQAWKAN